MRSSKILRRNKNRGIALPKEIFYPKCFFYSDEKLLEGISTKLHALLEGNEIEKFLFHILCKDDGSGSDLDQLNENMRRIKETANYALPGAGGEGGFDFINVLLLFSENKKKIIEEVVSKTSFKVRERENVNLYILISDRIFNKEDLSSIPAGASVQILVKNRWNTGQTIDDAEYQDLLAAIVFCLAVIPEKTTIIGHGMFINPLNKLFSANVATFFVPPLSKRSLIDNFFLQRVKSIISSEENDYHFQVAKYIPIPVEFPPPDKEIAHLKINTRHFRIPFFSLRKARNRLVSDFVSRHEMRRHQLLETTIERIEVKKEFKILSRSFGIVDLFFLDIQECLRAGYRLGSLIKSLREFVKKGTDQDKEKTNWKFIRDVKRILVDGRPFEKRYIIPFFILLSAVILVGAFYSFVSMDIFLDAFWVLLSIFGLYMIGMSAISTFYLRRKSAQQRSNIETDLDLVRDFLFVNPQNYFIAGRKYLKDILAKEADKNCRILIKALAKLQEAINSRGTVAAGANEEGFQVIQQYCTNDALNKILAGTVQNMGEDIYAHLRDPGIFIEALLSEFHKSDSYKSIKNIYSEKRKEEILRRLEEIKGKLPCGADTRILEDGRKLLFITPQESQSPDKNIPEIHSAHEDFWGLLNIATISPR
jgi:hypothetical protein